MKFQQFTYLILLFGSLLVPAILSFDKKVQFYKKLKYVMPGILITAIFFWTWDVWFTQNSIWSFNPEYTLGFNIAGMPVEEWLFFIIIPYCCIFIYEVLKHYLAKMDHSRLIVFLSLFLTIIFLIVSFLSIQKNYTFLTFTISATYLILILATPKFRKHLSHFYATYLVSLVPFMIVNGILTALPVVIYHPEHILNLRVMNIPVEDFSYLFLMLLMSISIYEYLKERKFY